MLQSTRGFLLSLDCLSTSTNQRGVACLCVSLLNKAWESSAVLVPWGKKKDKLWAVLPISRDFARISVHVYCESFPVRAWLCNFPTPVVLASALCPSLLPPPFSHPLSSPFTPPALPTIFLFPFLPDWVVSLRWGDTGGGISRLLNFFSPRGGR